MTQSKKEMLAGMVSALSYLESAAFKENLLMLRFGLRFAQMCAESELAENDHEKDIEIRLNELMLCMLSENK